MAKLWVTYAWVDNDDGDVDYVAKELRSAGLEIRIDRQKIQAGLRLWEQIDRFISDQGECDAWMIYATQASLTSEACREELAIALDHVLNARGGQFPLIALFPATVSQDLIPAAIRVRLFVSLTDPDWIERIVASAESRDARIDLPDVLPYQLKVYTNCVRKGRGHSIEIRPRAGTWARFLAGVPLQERQLVNPSLFHGPSGCVPTTSMIQGGRRGAEGEWWGMSAANEATPTMSYYLNCDALPTRMVFGQEGGQQYTVRLQ